MANRSEISRTQTSNDTGHCSDPVVGAILSGWRYDISGISPAVRTEYESHLATCGHCIRRQRVHRTVDVLLISVTTLSIFAFLLAIGVIHRVEALTHVDFVKFHLMHAAIAVSLEAVAVAGLCVSLILWILVAIMTPLPGFLGGILRQRMPEELRDRIFKQAA